MTQAVEHIRSTVLSILKPYASRIAVFGSYARGDETLNSDVDLLVRLRPPSQRPPLGLGFFEIEAMLADQLGRRVEIVTEDAMSPYVREHVIDDLIILYED